MQTTNQRLVRQGLASLLAGLILAGCAGQPLCSQAQPTVRGDSLLTIRVFDVDQADAILISTPEGKQVLIDGGRDSRVVRYMLAAGVDSLDLVLASHAHADHIVGLEAVFQSMPVQCFMDNGTSAPTAAYRDLHIARRLAHIPYRLARDTVFRIGSVRFQIMTSPMAGRTSENNQSLVIRVDYGAFSALFPGDAEWDEIQSLLVQGLQPVTLLKAAHHGARNGVTPGWLLALQPKVVVISVGRRNSYGHPDPWALRYYQAGGRNVYRTDLDGAITVKADSAGAFSVATTGSASR